MGVMTPYRAPQPPAREEHHATDALIGALAGSAAAVAMTLVANRLYRSVRRPPQRYALMIAAQIVWGAVLGWSTRVPSHTRRLRDR